MSNLSAIAQQVEQQGNVDDILAALQQAEQCVRSRYEVLGELLTNTAHLDAVAVAADEVSERIMAAMEMAEAFGASCRTAGAAIRGGA